MSSSKWILLEAQGAPSRTYCGFLFLISLHIQKLCCHVTLFSHIATFVFIYSISIYYTPSMYCKY